jgi:hypothetical protein
VSPKFPDGSYEHPTGSVDVIIECSHCRELRYASLTTGRCPDCKCNIFMIPVPRDELDLVELATVLEKAENSARAHREPILSKVLTATRIKVQAMVERERKLGRP